MVGYKMRLILEANMVIFTMIILYDLTVKHHGSLIVAIVPAIFSFVYFFVRPFPRLFICMQLCPYFGYRTGMKNPSFTVNVFSSSFLSLDLLHA